jgi:putative heme-binding domain-containing protein
MHGGFLSISGMLVAFAGFFVSQAPIRAQDQSASRLFARDNLVAWCIVPFDAKKRGPDERAVMLKRLGFKRFAYDWRAEHVSTFDAEMRALKRQDIKLEAFWFPAALNDEAKAILALLERHKLKTQLWITMGDPAPQAKDQAGKIVAAARILAPIADRAAKIGCTVGLYNHGGWFGEPENQLAVIARLNRANVGIVYNLHHGHDHLARLPALLKKMMPHLLALNLNGMVKDGDRLGKKIVPLGQGDEDLRVLKTIRDSGYRGPIGILGHTQDDAQERLRDNLEGLDWLVGQLEGKPEQSKPRPRTYSASPSAQPASNTGGWIAPGKAEYRTPPLTVESKVRLNTKTSYNILVASDTKQSGAHWEIFSMVGTGNLTVYLPGMRPDHVHSGVNICDGKWHDIAMHYEPGRVRLYCDGKRVADQPLKSLGKAAVPRGLAFGRLVEGGLGCDGAIDCVRIARGIRTIGASSNKLKADDKTVGLWYFGAKGKPQVEDLSKLKNPARLAVSSPSRAPSAIPPGPHLTPVDPRLKVVLLDRSANDAYLAVKADSLGRMFVGGREALFVFEPDAKGGYGPRRELCRFPQDSVIIGLEIRGNDLYVLTNSALYLLPEGRIRRTAQRPRKLLWGLPLNIHNSFHCLAWGPEGDLYLNHGDPLLDYGDWRRPDHWGHWTLHAQPPGTKVPYTGAGAVLRVRPDGSHVQVVAGGFRGPVGLAFDRSWSLFTNDNDHESRPDLYVPARLMHVTPHADFAWPRGWMASKSPDRADLLEPMIATLGRGVPCDLAYYDESYLADVLRHSLLMCRWDQFSVPRYPLQERGASFTTTENDFLKGSHNCRPVGVTVGRGGRVFVTALYLEGNVVSPYCPSDLVMITRADDPPEHPFRPYDVATAPQKRLWEDLSGDSWERRRRAHTEILRRGGELVVEATRRLSQVKKDDPAIHHLPWLAGASGSAAASRLLTTLASHSRVDVRRQAISALAEFSRLQAPRQVFVKALEDAAPQVQMAALPYFFNSQTDLPLEKVVSLARSSDTYLRQASTRLLARRATLEQIIALTKATDSATRLAGVLAAGFRLTVPPADQPPPPQVKLTFPADSAFFKGRISYADGEVDLRRFGRVGSFTTAEWWEAIAPSAEQKKLFDLLVERLNDSAEPARLQAGYFLSLLNDPRSEPLVAEMRRSVLANRLSAAPRRNVEKVWIVGPFDDGVRRFDQVHPPEEGVIDLTAEYGSGKSKKTWQALRDEDGLYDLKAFFARPDCSCYMYFRLQSATRQTVMLMPNSRHATKMWHNGQLVGRPKNDMVFLDAQPGSNDVLLRLRLTREEPIMTLRFRSRSDVVASLPEKIGFATLAQRLKEASGRGGQTEIAPEMLMIDWSKEAGRGNTANGRKLFAALTCSKCHAITADQQGGGAPSLAGAGVRFTVPYLVESILLPSKQVADVFRSTEVTTKRGRTFTGLVVSETADRLELLLPDASRQTVLKKEIGERKVLNVSPMPAGLVKKPDELRDLLAYLLSKNPLPP